MIYSGGLRATRHTYPENQSIANVTKIRMLTLKAHDPGFLSVQSPPADPVFLSALQNSSFSFVFLWAFPFCLSINKTLLNTQKLSLSFTTFQDYYQQPSNEAVAKKQSHSPFATNQNLKLKPTDARAQRDNTKRVLYKSGQELPPPRSGPKQRASVSSLAVELALISS